MRGALVAGSERGDPADSDVTVEGANGNAVGDVCALYGYRAGIPWRDLPERFGDWKIVHQRFSRWANNGVFERIFKLATKIHALVDALGNPVKLMLTPGQTHDLACAEQLIDSVDPDVLLGDKAYDADQLVDTLTQRKRCSEVTFRMMS